MTIELHTSDLPDGLDLGECVAVDTETMGLNPHRDPLCLVQLSAGDGAAHLVKFARASDGRFVYDAPRLTALLADESVTKLFHFARFDVAMIRHYLGIVCRPLYCTKIASRLARTYTDKHSLKELAKELLGIDLSKQQQSSDWGTGTLSDEQLRYAAADVLHLHAIREELDAMIERSGRSVLARACFDFVPLLAELNLGGWTDDVFSH